MADRGDPATRGRTVVVDRVYERTARLAALRTAGVVRHRTGVEALAGRTLPRVEIRRSGERVRVRVQVALAWPTPVGRTTAAVRDDVAATLTRVTGATVDAVDVTVTHLEPQDRRTT
ncbi:Asp23/Gls24 family envelope stress response protein [Phycicoccus flavus]|uniref:Asp23/Gls24 family envelope stress response protein n=1 Tax=Phycicoccus flavus TaxID=2502783 RepID=A0A8T6RBD1_9MICO|nr:Asp23/Gls24 family envelope stress response protein [Phycicoccus flavus]NHA70135.1 Asp23/Gls24 family envelope stress response protein [Phycicoccus flavus]